MYILADFSSSETRVKPHIRNGRFVRQYSREFVRKRSNEELKNKTLALVSSLGLGLGASIAAYPFTKRLSNKKFDRAVWSSAAFYPGLIAGNKLGEYLHSREYNRYKNYYRDSENLKPQVHDPTWKPLEKMTPQELRQTKYGKYTTNEWLTGSIL